MSLNEKEKKFILKAYEEDLGPGDCTTDLLIDKEIRKEAFIFAKEKGIISGQEIVQFLFQTSDPSIKYTILKKDSSEVSPQDNIAHIKGSAHSILKIERTALNFLQHFSGIATMTHRCIQKIKKKKVKLLDTRKTTPGLRSFEKQAVLHGGGHNHRFGLYDQILIKENHLLLVAQQISGSIEDALIFCLNKIKNEKSLNKIIEVEVQNKNQAFLALKHGADIILLDNMNVKEWTDTAKELSSQNSTIVLEASGNVNLFNIEEIAKTGVHRISTSMITMSAKSLDLSLLIQNTKHSKP